MKKSISSKKASDNGRKSATKPAQKDFLVVGIGASAGGIKALREFFENVPADSGVAYVVILHLSPDHESKLAEVLQNAAKIPVMQVNERVLVEPNHVYVVSPNVSLAMDDGHIAVSPVRTAEERHAPVDIFFRTLGESHHSRAVGVVLSGTGADGSMGIKRVKECGGVAFVQNPREAEYSDMPRNSIATDLIDQILNVGEIPAKIIDYKNNLGTVRIPIETENRAEPDEQALRDIFTQLRVRTKHDFSNYKRATILRRIERRMNVRDISNIAGYAAFLREQPEETQALLKDLLISVTNFFRDKGAFGALEREIIPRLLQSKNGRDGVRVWVAGCATGEEAYSIAMLLAEQIDGAVDAPEIQIFATDIDEDAIAAARDGFYTLPDAADVSADRLRRFFTKEADGYRIRREIREMILFANHNIIKDPPFSRLDLATCRNLLIYLNDTAQKRVMETFHFALNPGGFMFIGSSELLDGSSHLYAPFSKENHIFQSRQTGNKHLPTTEAPPINRFEEKRPAKAAREQETRSLERISYSDLHQQLLEQFAPPSIVINEEYDIVHLSESAGRYLQIAGGEPSHNLLKVVRHELRLELRTALYQAVQRRLNVETDQLKVRTGDRLESIKIHVRPVLRQEDTARGFLLVLFEPSSGQTEQTETVYKSNEPVARQLEEELIHAKSQLKSSIEQFEVQAEELKASNEELQAMNEELRSSAEELETGKEELQSINEELITVNQELKIKIEELAASNNNFRNLINSIDIGTIFLDRSLRVNLFSPAALSIFNLIPADFGRPLSDITNKLENADFIGVFESVLEKLQPVEREMKTTDDRTFLLRVQPYRTADDRIDGVVLTFLDITERKRAENELRENREHLQRAMEAGQIFSWELNLAAQEFSYSENIEAVLGFSPPAQIIQNPLGSNMHPEDAQLAVEKTLRAVETGEPYEHSIRFVNPQNGEIIWMHSQGGLMTTADGRRVFAGVAQNITERKLAEEALRESEEKFRRFVTVTSDVVYQISADWRELRSLDGKEFIHSTNEANKDWLEEYIPDGDRRLVSDAYEKAIQTKSIYELEHRVNRLDGAIGWAFSRAIPVFDEAGEIVEWLGAASDVTERKQAEAALRESEARIAADLAGMQRLYQLQSKLADQTDVEAAFRDILAVACDFTGTERGCVQFLSDDGTRLEMFVWQGYADVSPFIRFFRYEGLEVGCEVARVERQRLIIEDTAVFPSLEEGTDAGDAVRADKIRAAQSTPMTGRAGETIGVISTQFRSPHRPTDHELRLLDMLAWTAGEFLERHWANQAQREADARLQKAISAQTVGVLFFSLDGGIQDANETFERMSGYTRDELQNLANWEVLTPPEFRDLTARTAAEIAATGEVAPYEKQMFCKDGSRWWGLFAPTRLSGSGLQSQCVEFVIDIDERKQAEEALRESEEHYRAIINQNLAGILEIDLTGEVIFVNRQFCEMVGYDCEELTAMRIADFVHEDDLPESDKLLARMREEGTAFEIEKRFVKKDGTLIWVHNSVSAISGANGEPKFAAIISFDVTERRLAEDALRESEERLKLIMESIEDYAIITTEIDGIINGWNKGAENLFGYAAGEAIGRAEELIFTPEDRKKGVPKQELLTALKNGSAEDERWHLRKDGSRFFASGIMTFIKDANAAGFVKICRDQTEKLRAESALQEKETLRRLVGALEDERRRIARDIHDHFGQQLTALRMKLDQIKRKCHDQKICDEIDQAQAIAQNLDADVDFIAWELRPSTLDDLGLPATLNNFVREWAQHTKINGEFHSSGVGKERFESEAETNLYRIAQEALNNIYKHAEAENVSVLLEKRGETITLIIEDDGKGFNLDEKTLDNTGLGLGGMRERAKLCGGTLDIESTPGEGTTVFARVPTVK